MVDEDIIAPALALAHQLAIGQHDLVPQAVGRTPDGKKIAADTAGVAVTERGFINVDIQMRTNVSHIFAIGDIVGQPMLARKAVHEAHVAAEVIVVGAQIEPDWVLAAQPASHCGVDQPVNSWQISS